MPVRRRTSPPSTERGILDVGKAAREKYPRSGQILAFSIQNLAFARRPLCLIRFPELFNRQRGELTEAPRSRW